MKHIFIVNPTAGGHDATDAVRERWRPRLPSAAGSLRYTSRAPMDATSKNPCGRRAPASICVCMRRRRHLQRVRVRRGAASERCGLPFPTGTGNDFCRMFGEEADMYRDLDALLDGCERPIDLIDCNGRWCANICSVGIDARIGTSVHKVQPPAVIGGAAGYVVSAVVNVFQGINTNMYIKCGDFYAEGKHALVCVCNGRYYGGGFNPSLTARPDDGELDFFITRRVSLPVLAVLIGKVRQGPRRRAEPVHHPPQRHGDRDRL